MPREKDSCAFCPETANITGEHLWSAWAGKMLGEREYLFTRTDPDGRKSSWVKDELDLTANVVCGGCNGTWMSELETRMKDVAGEMMCHGTPAILNESEVETIAAFGFLKAVIADHMNRHWEESFYTLEERQLFRRNLTIPSRVQVWLARTVGGHGDWKTDAIGTPLNTPQRFQLNIFTYSFEYLVIQVIGSSWMKKSYRRHALPPRLTQPPQWGRASISIWPLTGSTISWPPAIPITSKTMLQFRTRWATLTRV